MLQAVKRTGLLPSDPRLRDCMDKLRQAVRESNGEVMMDHKLFHRCVYNSKFFFLKPMQQKCIRTSEYVLYTVRRTFVIVFMSAWQTRTGCRCRLNNVLNHAKVQIRLPLTTFISILINEQKGLWTVELQFIYIAWDKTRVVVCLTADWLVGLIRKHNTFWTKRLDRNGDVQFRGFCSCVWNIWVADCRPTVPPFPSLSIYSMNILRIVSNYSSWLEYKSIEITQSFVSSSDV